MSLTGQLFLLVVAVVCLGSFVFAVVVWPRLSAARLRWVLARLLILVVVNLLVLLTAAVMLNDHYTFYADWTDLRGSFLGAPRGSTTHAGGAAMAAANAGVANIPPQTSTFALPPLPPGASVTDRVLRYTLKGAQSGLTGSVLVTLPEGYTQAANAKRRYPVLETFPGYPGDPSQWVDSMNLAAVLDNAVATGAAGPMITISPTTEFPAGVDTECVNGTAGYPPVETWLTQDIPNWVLRTFRVRTDRASWATLGLSAGAWCAAMATALHPDRYAAGIIMGGYFAPEFSSNYRPFGSTSPQWRRYDLIDLARLDPPPVAFWIETSHSDPISYPSTARLLKAARAPLSIRALVLTHAGHRLSLWSSELPQAINWLGQSIPGFAFS